VSAPTKGPYFLHQDDGKMSIYPETWKGKPNREAMLALMATVSPWDGASQHDRSEVMAQAVANGHLLAASWEMREALEFYADPTRYHGPNQPRPDGDRFTDENNPYMKDVTRDGGAIARAALAKAQGEGR